MKEIDCPPSYDTAKLNGCESKITRGHNYTLVKKQSRLDVRTYSFSQRTINVWNKLSTDCVHASSVNYYVQEHNRRVSR